jgi:membrane-bound lytic murein transglycosylase A
LQSDAISFRTQFHAPCGHSATVGKFRQAPHIGHRRRNEVPRLNWLIVMSSASAALVRRENSSEFPREWAKPMRLRGVLLFLPAALVIADGAEGIELRRHSSSEVRRAETRRIVDAPLPKDGPTVEQPSGSLKIPNAALEPIDWGGLDGWSSDDHASAYATFYASCRPIMRASALRADSAPIPPARVRPTHPHVIGNISKLGNVSRRPASRPPAGSPLGSQPGFATGTRPIRSALEQVCARAVTAGRLDQKTARQFFETNFVPVRIRKLGDSAGFLTGYYEPIVEGSRFPTRDFSVPLYRRPSDLVAPGVADGAPFPNTGRAFRRTPTGELVPYYDRGEIEGGAVDGQHLEICWLRSAAEALSIQIEGSARIRLEDGTLLRVGYDAHNGYPFASVGRVLIERNLVPRQEMSAERIREWMHDNPEAARMIRLQNRQVVFFRIVGLNDEREAIGAQGIPLTAGRSIAVDKALHAYGTPFFIEADLPLTSPGRQAPFRRLMIAQDTGSAIVGPARADLFFGAGEEAGQIAGRIQQSARLAMFVPRELGSSIAAPGVPLPRAKPGPSLASYAFRPVAPPPATPAPSLRSDAPQVADRMLRPSGLKLAPSQVAARPLRSETPRPMARPQQIRAVAPAPPPKSEPMRASNGALPSGAPPSTKSGPSPGGVHQPASSAPYENASHSRAPLTRSDSYAWKRPQPRPTKVRDQSADR